MIESFSVEHLTVETRVCGWEEAIRISGSLLQKTGAATADYIDAMIRTVQDLGPYIVVVPRIALAHAEAGRHVMLDSLSLAVFKEPVYFGSENDPVHIVIAMCAMSNDSHLEQIQQLTDIFEDEQFHIRIMDCDTPLELYQLMAEKQRREKH
jgi:PTS system ascorbate-specific IIA component